MSAILWFAVASGLVALAYGLYATRSVLSASAGTERMQEIAGAVQEGARAYLNRQYLTISVVGLVLFAILTGLLGYLVGIGFLIGCGSFGRGRVHRDARLGAGERADCRRGPDRRAETGARRRLPFRRDHRPSGGGPRPPRRRGLLRDPADGGCRDEDGAGSPRGAGIRRLAHFDLRASRRRHLYQGRRRSAPTWSARWKPASPRTTRATRR